jgi:hypothetical protein
MKNQPTNPVQLALTQAKEAINDATKSAWRHEDPAIRETFLLITEALAALEYAVRNPVAESADF